MAPETKKEHKQSAAPPPPLQDGSLGNTLPKDKALNEIQTQKGKINGHTADELIKSESSYHEVLKKIAFREKDSNGQEMPKWSDLPLTDLDKSHKGKGINTRGSFSADDFTNASEMNTSVQNALSSLKGYANRGPLDEKERKQIWCVISMHEENKWAVGQNLKNWGTIAKELIAKAAQWVQDNPLKSRGWMNDQGQVMTDNTSLAGIRATIRNWLGVDYNMGGESKSGVDCSHFVRVILKEIFPNANIPWEAATDLALENPHDLLQIDPSMLKAHKFGIWAWPKPPGKEHGHTGFFILDEQGNIEIYDASSSKDEVVDQKNPQAYISYIQRHGGKFYSLTSSESKLCVNLLPNDNATRAA